jgi:hypothetical protein
MMSDALCLAIASAIWLRHALPMQRNKTLVRATIPYSFRAGIPKKQNDMEFGGAQEAFAEFRGACFRLRGLGRVKSKAAAGSLC